MQKTNKLNIRYYVLRLVAMMVVLAIFVGSVPVSAAKSKKVSSVDELSKEIQESASSTFVLNTEESIKINIPAKLGNVDVNLVINAPNATITNNAVFKSVSITSAASYTEKVLGNNISLKDKNTKFIVYKKKTVEKLTVYSATANIKIQKKAKIKELIFSKKAAKGNIAAEAGAVAKVMLKKKANLTVTGSKKANIIIYGNSKNSVVTTSVPVVLYANKSMKFNMEKGSEGSVIDSASSNIKVKVSNKSAKDPIRKVAGVEINETNISETKATPSPKPTATPTPKPITVSDNGNNVSFGPGISGDSGTSVGGGSSSGNSGGVIIGYSEGGNSGGYTGGGNSSGSFAGGGNSSNSYISGENSSSSYTGGESSGNGYAGEESSNGYSDNGNSENNSGSIVDNSTSNNSGNNQSGGNADATTDIIESENSIGNEGTSGNSSNNESVSGNDNSEVTTDVIDNSVVILQSVNLTGNNYRVWSSTVKSYLFEENGFLWRVEAKTDSGEIYVEKYTSSWEYLESRIITYDNDLIWGGFYHGKKFNFVILGQKNMDEDQNQMVVRVIEYDKQWNELGHTDLNGGYTSSPFSFGSLRCAEDNGYLFVQTCHQMYMENDGKRHQSNMFFVVDEENIAMSYTGYEMMHPGYVSHSFNQFVIVNEKGQFVTVDHGDGYPRGMVIGCYDIESGVYTGIKGQLISYFGGDFNSNDTGASLGGIEETTDGYVVVYNDDEKGGVDQVSIRNIYIDFSSKVRTDISTNTHGTRIEYSSDDNTIVSSSTPVIVSIGRDKGGYVLWEELDHDRYGYGHTLNKVCYVIYGVDGSVTDVKSFEGNLSDCKPIYVNGKILWYVTGYQERNNGKWVKNYSSTPCLYVIDTESGEVCRTTVNDDKENLQVSSEDKRTRNFVVENDNGTIVLFGKDIFDDNGKLIETEYYTVEGELYSKAIYTYDENGIMLSKTYQNQDNAKGDTVYEYYAGSKAVKSRREKSIFAYNSTDVETYSEYYESGEIKSSKKTQTKYKTDGSGEIVSVDEAENIWLENGKLIENSICSISGDNWIKTTTLYYENGNVKQNKTESTYSNGDISTTTFYYSEDGKKTRRISERNGQIKLEILYDEMERMIKYHDFASNYITTYDYHEDGTATQLDTYSNDNWIAFEYNVDGECFRSEKHYENGITITYYASGNKVLKEEYSDGTEENLYGYLLSNIYNEDDDGFTQVKEYNSGIKEIRVYKNSNHLISEVITDANGQKTVKDYDKEVANRIIKVEFSDGTEDNLGGYVITYTYNEDGSYEKIRLNSDNSKRDELYDKDNNIISYEFLYGNGNKQQIGYPLTKTATGSALVYEYFNDDETNSLMKRYTKDYNANNDLIRETFETYNMYGLNNIHIYDYDENNKRINIERITYFFNNGEIYYTKLYEYVLNQETNYYNCYLRNALEFYEDENHTLECSFVISVVNGKRAAITRYYTPDGILSSEKVDFVADTLVWSYYKNPVSGYFDFIQVVDEVWSRYFYEEGVLQKRIDFVNGLPSKYFIYQNNEFVETDPFEY